MLPGKKYILFILLLNLFSIEFSFASNSIEDNLINLLSKTPETEQAALLNELSYLYWDKEPSKSIEFAKRALALSEKYGQLKEKYNAFSNLNLAYFNHDTLNLSLKYSKEALSVAYQIGDSLLIARAQFELGTNYSEKGYYDMALKHLIQSLRIIESLNRNGKYNTKIAFITNNIGSMYSRSGEDSLAMKYYKYSLSIKEKLNDSLGIANMLNNMGLLYASKKNYEKAKEYYRKALEIEKNIGDKISIAETTLNLWELFIREKKFEKAAAYYDTIENYLPVMGTRTKIVALNNISHVWLSLNKPDKAIGYINKAIEFAKKSNVISLLSSSYKLLSEYYAAKSDYKNAYYYQKKSSMLKDSVMNSELAAQMAKMQAKYETEKKEKQIALLQKDKQLTQAEADKQRAMKLVYLVLSLVILFIAVFLIIEIRNKEKRKQQALEKQNLENERRLLRTQMNPHFLFNSLNTVQGFISSNDQFKAMSFLSKFGNLLRDILENSRENTISLEKELETLTLYIELEKLRYEDSFDYQIEIGDNIDPEQTKIPPLIIQPFVENAIKHGLGGKKSNGKLKITISAENRFLKIAIIDNGIGRKKAGELSEEKSKRHKSLGVKLTNERLKKTELATGLKTSFEIIDIIDDTGKPEGTKVIITIPYLT